MSVWSLDKKYLAALKEKEMLRMETLYQQGGNKAKKLAELAR